MKYTYDCWDYNANLRGRSGATGGTNLFKLRKLHKSFIVKEPEGIHLIIRNPDGKLVNFYHPYTKIEGIEE